MTIEEELMHQELLTEQSFLKDWEDSRTVFLLCVDTQVSSWVTPEEAKILMDSKFGLTFEIIDK